MLWHHMDRLKPEADNLIHIYVRECCKLRVISEVIVRSVVFLTFCR